MPVNLKHARCPLCKAPTVREFRPFCSQGCRDRDLIGWINEDYAIPARSTDADELQKSSDYGVDSEGR
ncbi:MAG: DNA gyrase inhibitor YacG [Sphingobium sp.]|nr:DNA gyrase inhibitor YacG [Sphingobium sp.]MBP6112231.1 DNA gyrase inhibitor YacG [Sphingobium sp.]MBP8671542.1 DNA gyrase inhibitor YacG [Sphingobium sp.]MBP9157318.1 DNA gyrase inhibitor YacG [Sphingobium sp.]MCC6481414.1 DNA gyrase inhibitor YacG [Sphingomonadaceae bacterium]